MGSKRKDDATNDTGKDIDTEVSNKDSGSAPVTTPEQTVAQDKQEQIEQTALGVSTWVEPMKTWIETAVSICKIANSNDLIAKKSLCLDIFGSNLVLENKKARVRVLEPQFSPQKNRWVLLRKTVISQTKQALSRPSVQFCPDLVDFYNQVRTEFERSA